MLIVESLMKDAMVEKKDGELQCAQIILDSPDDVEVKDFLVSINLITVLIL